VGEGNARAGSEDLGHIGLRRLGCVYGRRLATGSLCPSARRRFGRPRLWPRFSLSLPGPAGFCSLASGGGACSGAQTRSSSVPRH